MKTFFTFLIVFFFSKSSSAQIKYVTQNGSGSKNGSSWANAWGSPELANNLYAVPAGTQVWIAAGTYYPLRDENGGVLTPDYVAEATFSIPRGVKVYGGFAGTELSLNERITQQTHLLYKTFLSGDIGAPNDNNFDNILIIVTMKQSGAGEMLDGLTIGSGKTSAVKIGFITAATDPLVINNCEIRDNFPYGPAGLNIAGNGIANASLNLLNCSFQNNRSSTDGAISTNGCKLKAANCIFYSNASQMGFFSSCIHFSNTSGDISNCTFFQNGIGPAGLNGYAIIGDNATDSIYINNNIFWNNYTSSDVSNINSNGTNLVSVKNCLFQTQVSGTGPAVLQNSFSADPSFLNVADPDGADNVFGTADDGISLSAASSCIDKGANEFVNENVNVDIIGNPRVEGCKVDVGAFEYTSPAYTATGLYNGFVQTCTQYPVLNNNTGYLDTASCHVLTNVLPNGSNPVNGIVQVCVNNSPTVQFYNGVPYVQRYYDIIPFNNAATATARITVYYTQQDFDNYNAAAAGFLQLPTGPGDALGISHIIIEQDHGISLTGTPATYNGATIYIDPADNDIVWNATNGIWEVSFDVTGFSGFFMRTFFPVPVDLVNFSGTENNAVVSLFWRTASEINAKYFDLQKSTDGRNFASIGTKAASGNSNGSSYTMTDMNPVNGKNYYRLVMVDMNGSKKQSNILLIKTRQEGQTAVVIAPNPAHIQSIISITGNLKGKATIIMYEMNGKKAAELFSGKLNGNSFSTSFQVNDLPKGIYIIEVRMANEVTRHKLVVQ